MFIYKILFSIYFNNSSEKPKELLTPTHITKVKESSVPKMPSDSLKRKAEIQPPKPEKKRPGRPPLSQTQQSTPKAVSIVFSLP